MRERLPDPFEAAFEAAFEPWRSGRGLVCILYSGGVDSGVIAWELRGRPGTRLFTVGRSGSPDLTAAGATAPLIGLPWNGREVQLPDLDAVEAEVSRETVTLSPTARSVQLSLAIAFLHAPPGELLCGQGADELFLGYAHFAGLDPSQAESRSLEDLDRLLEDDWPRTQRIAKLLGRRVHAPFLDPRLVAAALAVPVDQRMPQPVPKAYWRGFARRRGVPEEIAGRPKRALQYGSGVDRWVRRGPKPPD
ncbi:MAG: asparagine synthase C-terminal domain-containing protein [Thermoplasmata archaeon]|nr:asparagine synthase C-terminal domain-containing protein [Thermoplasmata archaeon]